MTLCCSPHVSLIPRSCHYAAHLVQVSFPDHVTMLLTSCKSHSQIMSLCCSPRTSVIPRSCHYAAHLVQVSFPDHVTMLLTSCKSHSQSMSLCCSPHVSLIPRSCHYAAKSHSQIMSLCCSPRVSLIPRSCHYAAHLVSLSRSCHYAAKSHSQIMLLTSCKSHSQIMSLCCSPCVSLIPRSPHCYSFNLCMYVGGGCLYVTCVSTTLYNYTYNAQILGTHTHIYSGKTSGVEARGIRRLVAQTTYRQ